MYVEAERVAHKKYAYGDCSTRFLPNILPFFVDPFLLYKLCYLSCFQHTYHPEIPLPVETFFKITFVFALFASYPPTPTPVNRLIKRDVFPVQNYV